MKTKTFFLNPAIVLALLFTISVFIVLIEANELSKLKKTFAELEHYAVKATPDKPPEENFLQRIDRLLRDAIPVQQRAGEASNGRIEILNSHVEPAVSGKNALALLSVILVFYALLAVIGVCMLTNIGRKIEDGEKNGG